MFNKEKDMTKIVQNWLRPQVTHMETELWCGFAGKYIPDIVGISFDVEKVSQLKRRTPLPRSRIRKLLTGGYIPTIYHTDLVAIELKLTRFTQAFFQAAMYSHFGFRAYIAMPTSSYFNIPGIQREVLENMGIGVLSVSKRGCKEYIKASKPIVVNIEDEIQIAERLMFKGAAVSAEGGGVT